MDYDFNTNCFCVLIIVTIRQVTKKMVHQQLQQIMKDVWTFEPDDSIRRTDALRGQGVASLGKNGCKLQGDVHTAVLLGTSVNDYSPYSSDIVIFGNANGAMRADRVTMCMGGNAADIGYGEMETVPFNVNNVHPHVFNWDQAVWMQTQGEDGNGYIWNESDAASRRCVIQVNNKLKLVQLEVDLTNEFGSHVQVIGFKSWNNEDRCSTGWAVAICRNDSDNPNLKRHYILSGTTYRMSERGVLMRIFGEVYPDMANLEVVSIIEQYHYVG